MSRFRLLALTAAVLTTFSLGLDARESGRERTDLPDLLEEEAPSSTKAPSSTSTKVLDNPIVVTDLDADGHDSEVVLPPVPSLPPGITYEPPLVVAAAGDVVCAPGSTELCNSAGTAALLEGSDVILGLGDMQYESGTLSAFNSQYEHTWGQYKDATYPVVGNHEYYADPDASGFFAYFDHIDSDRYSFTRNGWKFIGLNSNCSYNGGCGADDPQALWLEKELSDSPECTIAYWHHPRFSSGVHGDDTTMEPLWDLLSEYGAELVLSGHDHHYERFTPIGGVQQFVSGLGGKNTRSVGDPHEGSEVRYNDELGVLFLSLYDNWYSWEFVTVSGKVVDSGSRHCDDQTWHGPIPEEYGPGTGCTRDEASVVAQEMWGRGATDSSVEWMLYVISRESLCDPSAHNGDRSTGDDSWGLCQQNNLSGWFDEGNLLGDYDRFSFSEDFALNAESCAVMWEECGKGPWTRGDYGCSTPSELR